MKTFKGAVKHRDGGLRIAVLGDVHLGHPNTTTSEILKTLYACFPDTAETGELDLIIFEGDVFDRLMFLPDDNVVEVRIWINRLLKLCKRRDIMVRVLEGTPSHDRGQSVHFKVENDTAEIGVDLEYVTTLSIEYIARFGVNVLYIPDEWKHEPDDTWKDVQFALADHGLTQVDFIVMHGAFTYQLPPQMAEITHDVRRYLSIVRYFVFIGHIHKRSTFSFVQGKLPMIAAAGSTDRLTHGEEEPKGHLRVTLRSETDYEVVFVENTGAKLYCTFDCTGLPVEAALEKLAVLDTYPPDSYVRIAAAQGDAIFAGLDALKSGYPLLNFSTKQTDLAKGNREAFSQIITPFTPAAITASNIVELLLARLTSKGVDPSLLKRAELLLRGQIS